MDKILNIFQCTTDKLFYIGERNITFYMNTAKDICTVLDQTATASTDPKIIFDSVYAVLLKYIEHKKNSC